MTDKLLIVQKNHGIDFIASKALYCQVYIKIKMLLCFKLTILLYLAK